MTPAPVLEHTDLVAPARRPVRSRSVAGRVVSAVLAVVLLGAAGYLVREVLRPPSDALLDLDGNHVVLDPFPDVEAAQAVPLDGVFFAPSLGLSAPLVAMNVTDGVINPPSLTDAFLVRGFGTPGDDESGLVVVAFHAVRGGNAVGNAFFDMEPTASPVLVSVGDPIWVDDVEFVVTGAQVLDRDAAAASSEIWGDAENRHGELIVLTCLQRVGATGQATENLVIHAVRA